jgi:hypothetical protein
MAPSPDDAPSPHGNRGQGDARGGRRVLQDLGPWLGIGSSLAATVLLCLWVGHWLDAKYGTTPRYFLLGAAFGMLSAFYHFYRMYKSLTGKKK